MRFHFYYNSNINLVKQHIAAATTKLQHFVVIWLTFSLLSINKILYSHIGYE